MSDLIQKKCIPCEAGMSPLEKSRIAALRKEIPDWEVLGGKKIAREFKHRDFKEAMAFVNEVADIAELEGHHPDILLHGWNKVRIELSTHATGGLSENDFIEAAKIDALL
ncbi:MAG: hypothetical protein COU47_01565 [Candidatus Niyogibacteria bacterium CG10_big_fil_rev_8_21_14_0_10_46_36]|uniref:Putative pterin-4-alpha-carbinolamine dehydratase n=1 Tax=Candidatus Niyogibacteria bacterium CG10_big_fil_rev_8_21_14_0_10_46_36 TaxID=1974726 RepID=A0A2H0TE30_9BACT|nr:MAG: hypothetical protein COU47_01565 [Candidatus Niyogibacteria bacterium CG10_big_fil_rev_8_21_14_0_10_46_36]